MRSRLKMYFITGLLVVVPVALTGYILWILISLMDGVLNVLPSKLHPNTYLPFRMPGLGLIMTVILILLTGMVTRSVLGKKVVSLGEWAVGKIPMVRNIYNALKQLTEAIFMPRSEGFRRVVLIEYPRKGIFSLGFVTGVTRGETQQKTQSQVINVFVPTTPNPTSGYYIMVPEQDAWPLKMSVEDAFKIIISGGMVTPQPKEEKAPGDEDRTNASLSDPPKERTAAHNEKNERSLPALNGN
jgi:uncharacterized membrane protein